jgi:hypothetical protein
VGYINNCVDAEPEDWIPVFEALEEQEQVSYKEPIQPLTETLKDDFDLEEWSRVTPGWLTEFYNNWDRGNDDLKSIIREHWTLFERREDLYMDLVEQAEKIEAKLQSEYSNAKWGLLWLTVREFGGILSDLISTRNPRPVAKEDTLPEDEALSGPDPRGSDRDSTEDASRERISEK